MNKTCGGGKHHTNKCHCEKFSCYAGESDFCDEFEPKTPPTIGDKIRGLSNEGIAAVMCGLLNSRDDGVFEAILNYLNAPAESEGEDGLS